MISPEWMQESFYRRIVTRYEGKQQSGGLIFYDTVLPFSSLFSMTVLMKLENDPATNTRFGEARMYLENRRGGEQSWNCTLWLQGYGNPRRNKPELEICGNEEQMCEDIIFALLFLE